jgi:hypothetical protein
MVDGVRERKEEEKTYGLVGVFLGIVVLGGAVRRLDSRSIVGTGGTGIGEGRVVGRFERLTQRGDGVVWQRGCVAGVLGATGVTRRLLLVRHLVRDVVDLRRQ